MGGVPRSPQMERVFFPEITKTRLTEPILEHEMRIRAYELYVQRGKIDGHALEDWLQAEVEVLGRVLTSGDFWNIH
jgi:hypothetical protein